MKPTVLSTPCILSTSKTQARRELEKILGKPLAGVFFCHHCDNPKCKNPDHIFLGGNSANMKDCFAKGRNTTFAGWNLGIPHKEETKKISESGKIVWQSEDHRKKMSEAMKKSAARPSFIYKGGKPLEVKINRPPGLR